QRVRFWIRRRESPDHGRVELSRFRRALELRHTARNAALCALRSRQGELAGKRRGRARSNAGTLRSLRLCRQGPENQNALPAAWPQADRRVAQSGRTVTL